MEAVPFTRSVAVLSFIEFFRRENLLVLRQLEQAGLHPDLFHAPEALVPLEPTGRFVENMARRTGMEDLGLRVGAATPISRLGLFGSALSQSATLNELLRKLVRLGPVFASGLRIWMEPHPDGNLEVRLRNLVREGQAQVHAYSLMVLIDVIRLTTGPNWRPRRVRLAPEMTRFASRYEALGEAEAVPAQDAVAVALPRSLLALPVRRPPLPEEAAAPIEPALHASGPATDFVGSVAEAIRALLYPCPPTAAAMAEMISVSTRSFHRRLADQGVTYKELVDRVRFEEAVRLLASGRVKLAEIARRLGYTDAANFTRAFRRWTGSPPSHFQRTTLQSRWFPAPTVPANVPSKPRPDSAK